MWVLWFFFWYKVDRMWGRRVECISNEKKRWWNYFFAHSILSVLDVRYVHGSQPCAIDKHVGHVPIRLILLLISPCIINPEITILIKWKFDARPLGHGWISKMTRNGSRAMDASLCSSEEWDARAGLERLSKPHWWSLTYPSQEWSRETNRGYHSCIPPPQLLVLGLHFWRNSRSACINWFAVRWSWAFACSGHSL